MFWFALGLAPLCISAGELGEDLNPLGGFFFIFLSLLLSIYDLFSRPFSRHDFKFATPGRSLLLCYVCRSSVVATRIGHILKDRFLTVYSAS